MSMEQRLTEQKKHGEAAACAGNRAAGGAKGYPHNAVLTESVRRGGVRPLLATR